MTTLSERRKIYLFLSIAVLAAAILAITVFTVPESYAYAVSEEEMSAAAENSTPVAPQGFNHTEVLYGEQITGFDMNSLSALPSDQRNNIVIKIPEKFSNLPVTEIGSGAFSPNSSLVDYSPYTFVSIDLSEAVQLKTIKANAFDGCTSLTGVLKIPKSVTTIEEGAFKNCSNLQTIYLPDTYVTYGESAFAGVTCPIVAASVTRYNTCYSTINMNNLTFEKDVTFNPKGGAFKDKGIDETITQRKLNSQSFQYEKSANEIWAINENYEFPVATKINYKFKGIGLSNNNATILTSENADKGDYFAKYDPLMYATTFSSAGADSSYTITGFFQAYLDSLSSTNLPIVIPAVYDDMEHGEYPVVAISDKAFKLDPVGGYYFKITSLDLTQAVNLKTIGTNAFPSVKVSGNLTIPDSVTSIGSSAFSYASFDGMLKLPENPEFKVIQKSTFYEGKFAGGLSIPKTVTTIENEAFYTCVFGGDLMFSPETNLTEIGQSTFANTTFTGNLTIPDSVTTIGHMAFSNSKFPGTLTLSKNLESVQISTFSGCKFTGSLNIPASIKSIGSTAFYECAFFENLTFEKNSQVTTIGNSAFSSCQFTGELIIPASVREIGPEAFSDCAFNGSLTFESGSQLQTIGNKSFFRCFFTGNLEIPANVISIGERAFADYWSSSLDQITFKGGSLTFLTDKLTTIGAEAFDMCSFAGVLTIPDSVSSIGAFAFGYLDDIKTVYLPNNTEIYYSEDIFRRIACPIVAPNVVCFENATRSQKLRNELVTYERKLTFYAGKGMLEGGASQEEQLKLVYHSHYYVKNAENVWAMDRGYRLPIAVKENCIFSGWNSKENGSGQTGEEWFKSDIGFNTNLTFYAQYIPFFNASYTEGEGYTINGFTSSYLQYLFDQQSSAVNIEIIIPDTYNDDVHDIGNVVAIGNEAFYKKESGVKFCKLVFNTTALQTIGSYSFAELENLAGEIVIPKTVTQIQDHAFYHCYNISKVTYETNSTLTEIGASAFETAAAMSTEGMPLEIPNCNTLTTIGEKAFAQSGISGALIIPDSVTAIGTLAFQNCSKLTSLKLPSNGDFTTINQHVFAGCGGLSGLLVIPVSVTKIDNFAFWNCDKLGTVFLLKNGIVDCYGNAFSGVTCPLVVADQSVYRQYKDASTGLANYSNLTYELQVSFHPNGGIVREGSLMLIVDKLFGFSMKYEKNVDGVWAENSEYTFPSAEKTNCSFIGWNSKNDNSGAAISQGVIGADTPLTYYAIYDEILDSLTVNGTLTKLKYSAFEKFDPDGITVTANYLSGVTEVITSGKYSVVYAHGESLLYGDSFVTISYQGGGITKEISITGLTVVKIRLTVPIVNTPRTYNGSKQTVDLLNFDDNLLTIVEGSEGITAGKYNAVIKLNDTNNYEWDAETQTEQVIVGWTIAQQLIEKPLENDKVFTYSGEKQYYTLTENSAYTVKGNEQTIAGKYPVTFSLKDKDNTTWAGGSVADLEFEWVINKLSIELPEADTRNFVYSGEPKTYSLGKVSDRVTVSSNIEQTEAGKYTITVSLKDTVNTTWADDSIADLKFEWVINKLAIELPEADTRYFIYSGEPNTYSLGKVSDRVTVSSNIEQTEAGKYTITVSLKDTVNTTWAGGSVADLKFEWVINKLTISEPLRDTNEFTYSGEVQTYRLAYLSPRVTVSSNVEQTAAGKYTITVSLNDKVNTTWGGGSIADLKYEWVINKLPIPAPLADSREFTYNGQLQTYSLGYVSDRVTVSSNVEQTEAGEYTITAALNDKNNTMWIGGDDADLTFKWNIAKASYNMGGISFEDATIKENGEAHKLEIRGTLPTGVTARYTGNTEYSVENGVSKVGVYTVTVTFIIEDSDNYNVPEPVTRTLTINQAQLSVDKEEGKEKKEAVVVESEHGIAPYITLQAEDISETEHGVTVNKEEGLIKQVYDISLLQNGADIQPDGEIIIRLLIAANLRKESNLKVYHFDADGNGTDVNAVREGDYMVFATSSLSKFAIVGDDLSAVVTSVVLAIMFWALALAGGAYLIYYYVRKKNVGGGNGGNGGNADKGGEDGDFKDIKTYSVAPLFLALAIVPAEIIAALAAGIVAFLAVASIIIHLHIKDGSFKRAFAKRKTGIKAAVDASEAETAVCEAKAEAAAVSPDDTKMSDRTETCKEDSTTAAVSKEVLPKEPVQDEAAVTAKTVSKKKKAAAAKEEVCEVKADQNAKEAPVTEQKTNSEKKEDTDFVHSGGVRYRRSFLSKLIQGSEINKYFYGALKNELLSYNKTHSSVSFTADTVTTGRKRLAKFAVAGKTLKLFLALDPATLEKKYRALDVGEKKRYAKTPCCLRVKSELNLKKTLVLIGRLMQENELTKNSNFVPTDYAALYPYEETEALVERGLVKKIVKGNDNIKADIPFYIRGKITAVEAMAVLSDEAAATLVMPVRKFLSRSDKTKKAIVNIDSLRVNFKANDIVTLESLKNKKLVSSNVGFVKILARGYLNKPLSVEANDFSIEAVKMILLTGGQVLKIE